MSRKTKISLIGAGNIGGTLAHIAVTKSLGDIILFDLNLGRAKGKALDIAQAATLTGFDGIIKGTDNYEDIIDSEVIIVTAGIARKPGMSRDDLISTNSAIIKTIAVNIKKYAPEAFVIVITNPLDAMVYIMQKAGELPPQRVVGMAGILDSARFNCFLAEELKVSVQDVTSFVLGGHGDAMVPLVRYSTVSGIPVSDLINMGYITQNKIDAIVERTRNGGGEIVSLLKDGSAYYAPASAAIVMAESYLGDKRKIMPCAAYLQGEYGLNDIYVGVPVIIGKGGVEKIIEIKLTPKEGESFKLSVKTVQELIKSLKID